MSFADLKLKQEYRSPQDNVVKDFYLPILCEAVSYKRSVGYFSSSALIQISKGICKLAKTGGTIELVASPHLSEEDMVAIEKGYENRERIIENALIRNLTEVHSEPFAKERLNFLANLIEKGVLNIKIAFIENSSSIGMYHEKLGLVEDISGNKIAFSGSMNESANAMFLNYEAIDVFCSWKGEESKSRVLQKEEDFSRIWENYDEKLCVKSFPAVDKAILQKYKRKNISDEDYDIDNRQLKETEYRIKQEYLMENCEPVFASPKPNIPRMPSWLKLHAYQEKAIEKWTYQNYCGIFDMATGTGKTLTGLSAIVQLFNDLKGNICVIILCPYIHLVTQWVEEIEKFNITPIIAFGSSQQKDWKERLKHAVAKRNFRTDSTGFFCLVSTIATFKREEIQRQVKRLTAPILLISDEAHNLGASNTAKYFSESKFQYRLALSATLDRHFDAEGTKFLYNFFGYKCISYGLKQAIKEKYLTPYKYYPIVVTLDEEEREEYRNLTKSIISELKIDKESGKKKLSEKGKRLAILRSRIIAGARSKIPALLSAIEPYKLDNQILVYCGSTTYSDDTFNGDINNKSDIRQIEVVMNKVYEKYKISISKFTAQENNEQRKVLIEKFSEGKELQVLAAIRCLDEGVNIPSIKTAFILASSTNPKEYIQRRGRVLRVFEGKRFAEIYDFVTLPYELDAVNNKSELENLGFAALAQREFLRVKEFSSLAMNELDSFDLLERLKEKFSLDKNNYMEEFVNE